MSATTSSTRMVSAGSARSCASTFVISGREHKPSPPVRARSNACEAVARDAAGLELAHVPLAQTELGEHLAVVLAEHRRRHAVPPDNALEAERRARERK